MNDARPTAQRAALTLSMMTMLWMTACGEDAQQPQPTPTPPSQISDVIAPGVRIDWPTAREAAAGQVVEVRASAWGASLRSARLLQNGQEVASLAQRPGALLFNATLVEGLNVLSVEVSDGARLWRDEVAVYARTVATQPAPELTITAPQAGEVFGEDVAVTGEVVARAQPEVSWSLDGEAAQALTLTQVADGRWTFSTRVAIPEGAHTLVIRALNDDGADEVSLSLTRAPDTEAPRLVIASPATGHSVRSRLAHVWGQVEDNDRVVSVEVERDARRFVASLDDEGHFSARVPLDAGENTFALIITDRAGLATRVEHTLYLGNRLASGGAHGGAVRDGALFTWGRNNKGQLGLGFLSALGDTEPAHPTSPVHVNTSWRAVSIAFNQNASAALDDQGHVWTWGDGARGQLGLGTPDPDDTFDAQDRLVPEQIAGLSEVVAITRGYSHTLALDAQGGVWAWGDNSAGQLGDGTTTHRDVPVQVQGLGPVIHIEAGSASSYAVLEDGTVWAWGRDQYGNLGQGTEDTNPNPTPVQVPGLEDITMLATGRDHVLALRADGRVLSWGLNASQQAGLASGNILSPTLRDDITGAVSVQANGNQSFFEAQDGTLWGWGQNGFGNLGMGEKEDLAAPQAAVFGLSGLLDCGVGALQTFAMRADGKVFGWGWSFQGSLGGGDSTINAWGYQIPILVSFPEVAP